MLSIKPVEASEGLVGGSMPLTKNLESPEGVFFYQSRFLLLRASKYSG